METDNKLGYLFMEDGWECPYCGKRKVLKEIPNTSCPNCREDYTYSLDETRFEYEEFIKNYIEKRQY